VDPSRAKYGTAYDRFHNAGTGAQIRCSIYRTTMHSAHAATAICSNIMSRCRMCLRAWKAGLGALGVIFPPMGATVVVMRALGQHRSELR
jgi:hypothetical protein